MAQFATPDAVGNGSSSGAVGAEPSPTVLSVEDALVLMRAVALRLGASDEDAVIIARHLVDDELRGVPGMSRIFIVADEVARDGVTDCSPISVVRDGPSFALIDGGQHLGYVVAEHATRLAIEKAKSAGIAVVAARNHRYSGTLAYYCELAAREGLVAMATASGFFGSVAPHRGRKGRLDTNPLAFGFPTSGTPVVWDIATSAISGSEVGKRKVTGQPLPEGVAIDADGRPTVDPEEALRGALLSWGGHRGSGLAVSIKLLSLLAGVPALPDPAGEAAFLVVVIDPGMLLDPRDYENRATVFAESVRSTPPVKAGDRVRMPFDRSIEERERRRRDGIPLAAAVRARLEAIARD
jgi:delta1-piperideine-2-carboxylate reductase